MTASVKFFPGATIRWRGRQYVIVDYAIDAVIGREPGRSKLERIPIAEAQPDQTERRRAVPDLAAVSSQSWELAVEKFKALKPLLEMDEGKRTRAAVTKVARTIGQGPSTVISMDSPVQKFGTSFYFAPQRPFGPRQEPPKQ